MEGIFFSTTMMRQETNSQIINTAKPGQFDLGNNVANDILIFARQTCNLSGFPRSVLAGTSNTVAQSSRLRCHSDQSNLDSNSSYHGLDFLADICMIKHNLVPSSASSLSSACTSPLPPMRNTVALAAPESCRTSSRGPEKSDDEHLKCLKLTVPPSSGNTRKDVDNARWVSRFNELVDYYCVHKHPNVPFRYNANPKLGGWVQKQRDFKKKCKLAPFKETALNSIGFSWVLEKKRLPKVDREGIYNYEDLWEFRFDQLREFKAVHGHCNVPYRYPIDPTLGRWVQNQREFRKKRTLRKDRVERLEELGFQWVMRKGNKSRV
ncbi:hypothetical protein ACHAXS_000565 [Conticribra weissflogii]